MKKDIEEVKNLKYDTITAKGKLMEIADELYRIGAIRESNSLYTIIEKLEIWQNK